MKILSFVCAFIRMAGIVRGSVGGACINNFTYYKLFFIVFVHPTKVNPTPFSLSLSQPSFCSPSAAGLRRSSSMNLLTENQQNQLRCKKKEYHYRRLDPYCLFFRREPLWGEIKEEEKNT